MEFLLAELPASPPVPFALADGKWVVLHTGAVIMLDEPGFPLAAYFPGAGGMAMALRVNDALRAVGLAEEAKPVLWTPNDT